jgi:hypothetical protein
MHKYKIHLLKPTTLIGYIISIATWSKYSHSIVEINGVLYDSSETRGTFDVSDLVLGDRPYLTYEFRSKINLKRWAGKNLGKEYDWLGVFGWFFDANDKNKFYCFEATYAALYHAKITDIRIPTKLSADDLIDVMEEYKKRIA